MPRPQGPLDPTEGVVQQFAADLRRLREQVGSPGYRDLARRAHFSAATLSAAAAGKKLPSLAVTLAYAQTCGGDRAEWETRWRSVAAELAPAEQDAPTTPNGAPYVGLASFQPDDADRFFGREHLVEQLTQQVTQRRFTVVFGPSGSGKSSLLRAGLIPAISANHADWPVVLLTPGEHPLAECATHLARLLRVPAGTVLTDLTTDPHHLHLAIRQALVDHPEPVQLLLVVDQFEELFTLCTDAGERGQFVAALLAAAQASTSRVRAVLGVRADFYGNCSHYPDLVDALRDGQTLVGPMQADELRAAIIRPATRAGLAVEATLVATIVTEMLGRTGALPLMSHALAETWRHRRGTTLSLAGYHSTGGIDGAVTQTAERTYTTLTIDQQHAVRDIMLRLTALGENTEDTRRRVPTSELDRHDPAVARAVDAFTHARLLTLGEDTIEIAHEALIHAWPRLRDWLTEDRDSIHIHHRLTDATRTWEDLGRDAGALYRGLQLTIAHTWHTRRCTTTLTPSERDFLNASIAAHRWEQRTRRRRITLLLVMATALIMLAAVATAVSINAAHQRHTADPASRGNRPSATAIPPPATTIPPPTVAYSVDARAATLTRQFTDARAAILPIQIAVARSPNSPTQLDGRLLTPFDFTTTQQPNGSGTAQQPGGSDSAPNGVILDSPRQYSAALQLSENNNINTLAITVGHLKPGTSPRCEPDDSGFFELNCVIRTLADGTRMKTFEGAISSTYGTTKVDIIYLKVMEAGRPSGTYIEVDDEEVANTGLSLTTGPPLFLSDQDLVKFATVFTY